MAPPAFRCSRQCAGRVNCYVQTREKGGGVDGTPSNITRRGIVIFDVTMTETPLLFPVPHPQT
jgi:hypothetical protein